MRGVSGHKDARPRRDAAPSTAAPWSRPCQVSTGEGLGGVGCQTCDKAKSENMGLKGDAEKEAPPASLTWTCLEKESIKQGAQQCCPHVSRAPPRGTLQKCTWEARALDPLSIY